MKKYVFSVFTLFFLAGLIFGQKLPTPKQLPTKATAAQAALIAEGSKLHDAGRFDEAIAKYQQVISENPDCTEAIYELSLSYYTKGDRTKAMETAYSGAKYKADELPLLYSIMANCLDDVGKPDEAISIYRQAESMLKGEVGMSKTLSSVYYNLGVTYARQKKNPEARTELKKAVESDYTYPSPHYVLAVVYNNAQYKVPAFMAAARLLSLEPGTQRSKNAAAIIMNVLKPAPKDEKTGNINIFLNMDAPKDEGDFGMYDLFLGTMLTVKSDKDKNKSDNEIFAEAVDSVVALISEDKKLVPTFVGKQYSGFLTDMKKKGYTDVLAYLVLFNSGRNGSKEWLDSNSKRVGEFIAWAKAYQIQK